MIGVPMDRTRVQSPAPLDVETARPEDAAEIARLLCRCAPETVEVPEREIRRHVKRYRVIRSRGSFVIATAAVLDHDHETSEIRSLAVDPRWRGRGLATRLLRRILRQIRSQGRRLRCVTVRPGFFARHGFRRTPIDAAVERPGRPMTVEGRPRIAMIWSPLASASSAGEGTS